MMDHSPVCFENEMFMDCVTKVRNQELHYTAIEFYLDQEPMQLGQLLATLTADLEPSRVVHMMRKSDNIPLVLQYLKSVQKNNDKTVNEAINQCYIEEEVYSELRNMNFLNSVVSRHSCTRKLTDTKKVWNSRN